jgi:hypothetical protein
MNETSKHELIQEIKVQPIFPQAIDFEHLLINKFET